jgi:hypothetical protein
MQKCNQFANGSGSGSGFIKFQVSPYQVGYIENHVFYCNAFLTFFLQGVNFGGK